MSIVTSDLCDANEDAIVLAPVFRDFGGKRAFAGRTRTLQVHEDNALVRSTLETPGNGDVLVIDGGGSVRTALVGGNLGKLAETNGWSGIIVYGAVRDTLELAECKIGIRALAACPRKSEKKGAGERALSVTFAGASIAPDDAEIGREGYADADGIVLSARPLTGP